MSDILYNTYVTLNDADIYFSNRLKTEAWDDATIKQKNAALIEATRRIDSLNFIGTKTDLSQDLEFPRYPNIIVPIDIKVACLEIVYNLLDEVDPDLEIENIAVINDRYSSVGTVYNRDFTLEHIQAGIPSALAWSRLLPYLVNPQNVKLKRV